MDHLPQIIVMENSKKNAGVSSGGFCLHMFSTLRPSPLGRIIVFNSHGGFHTKGSVLTTWQSFLPRSLVKRFGMSGSFRNRTPNKGHVESKQGQQKLFFYKSYVFYIRFELKRLIKVIYNSCNSCIPQRFPTFETMIYACRAVGINMQLSKADHTNHNELCHFQPRKDYKSLQCLSYCWWKKSCTTWDG